MGDAGDSDSDSSSTWSITTESEFSVTGEWTDSSEETDQPPAPKPAKKSKHLVTPGVCRLTFEAIKKKITRIPPKDRICALLMLEIDVHPHLNYLPREDYIIGFEDFGWQRDRKVADNATVFMLRSVYGKWKQPVAFMFYDWPISVNVIVRFLKEIAKESKAAGLTLIATVCTHAEYNVDALNVLLNETKTAAEEKGVKVDDDVVILEGQEIVVLFDSCTLLMSMRNNLLERNLEFKKNGVVKVAKWKHIQDAFEVDCKLSEYLKKITENHVNPERVNKSSVTTSIQVFSSTVAGFLTTVAGNVCDKYSKTVPLKARETAELLSFMDRIFDSVNGMEGENFNKPLRGLVTRNSPHSKVWAEGKEMLAEMSFINWDPNLPNKSFIAWPRTLNGFEMIKKKLASLGYDSFSARSFNLDPLENCFDLMREWVKKKRNQRLTCMRFSIFYNRALESKDVSGCHATNANCEPDGLSYLVTCHDFCLKSDGYAN